MEPGLPALIVLIAACGLGYAIGAFSVLKLGGLQHLGPLATQSLALCCVSSIFFAWAAYKLLALHDPDLGVVSFLIAFTASYRTADLCAVHIRRGSQSSRSSLLQQRTLHPLALLVVAANYLYVLVAIDGLPSVFRAYLIIGALFWTAVAARIRALLSDDYVKASFPTYEQERLAASDGS